MNKREIEIEVARLKHDIEAYRVALGYPTKDHDGRLCDGTTPKCGLCSSQYTIAAKAFYDQKQADADVAKPSIDLR